MPVRELRQKFRISELALLGWRSQEQSAAMSKRFAPPQNLNLPEGYKPPVPGQPEPDASKMTGQQLLRHLWSVGFHPPIIVPPGTKHEPN